MGCASSAPARDDAASSSREVPAVPTLDDGSVNVEATLATFGIADDRPGDDATEDDGRRRDGRETNGGGGVRRAKSLRSMDGATARRTASINVRRSARTLGESPSMQNSLSARSLISPVKEARRNSGTTKGGAFGRSGGGGRVDATQERERRDGATPASDAAHEFEKWPGRRQEGESDGLPPMASSARATPHASRSMGAEHGERDERGGRPSVSKFRGDEQTASKDVKGRVGCRRRKGQPSSRRRENERCTRERCRRIPGCGVLERSRRRRERRVDCEAWRTRFSSWTTTTKTRQLTPEEFSNQVQSLMRSMRERQAFLRKLTMETIELCKPLVELEAPIETLLRLREIDEAATARDDKERERLRDRDEPEMPSHAAKTRTLSLDSFEISSALSAYDYEKRAPARGDSEFSLDGIEEELRSVDELLKETSAVGT